MAVFSAIANVLGADKAADAQTDAANTAAQAQTDSTAAQIALQREMYNQTRNDFAPYRSLGTAAVNKLTARMNNKSPYNTYQGNTLSSALSYTTPRGNVDIPVGSRSVNNIGGRTTQGYVTPTGQYLSTMGGRPMPFTAPVSTESPDSDTPAPVNAGGAINYLKKLGLGV